MWKCFVCRGSVLRSARGVLAALALAGLLAPSLVAAADKPREVPPPGLRKTTLATWEIKVVGAPFAGLTNEDAGLVLRDWLTNALLATSIFNVVDRDRMQAVLSEQQLASAGLAVDTGRLVKAGQLLKVNEIVLGSVKNLGQTTEVDFKLLDVNTTTYTLTLDYSLPFSSSIEVLKPEIERVVAGLASRFPVNVSIAELVDERHLAVSAGADAGVAAGFRAVVVRSGSHDPVVEGRVVAVAAGTAQIELDAPAADLNLFDFDVQLRFASEQQASAERGMRSYQEGHYAEAVGELGKAVTLNPHDTAALLNLARSAWKLGDVDRAVETYRRAAVLRPDDATVLDELATVLLESGRLVEARQLVPPSPAATTAAGLAVQAALAELSGERAAARSAWNGLRQLATNGEALAALALLSREEGDEAAASALLDSGDAATSPAIALLRAALHEPISASAVSAGLQRAEAARDVAGLTRAARLYAARQQWEAAREIASRALALQPDATAARLAAADAAFHAGELAAALALLDQGILRRPDSWPLHRQRGALLLAAGSDPAGAVASLEKSRQISPGERATLEPLAAAWRATGDAGRAAAVLRELIAGGRAVGGAALASLAESQLEVGDVAGASASLERCVAEAPEEISCRYRLGVLALEGQLPGGAERARELLEPVSTHADAALRLAQAYETLHRPTDAARLLRQCLDARCPGWQPAAAKLARVEAQMGRVSGAAPWDNKQVYVDLGTNVGVKPGQRLAVLGNGRLLGELTVSEVEPQRSLTRLTRGSAPAGATVRGRPLAPHGVAAHRQSGPAGDEVIVSWQIDEQPEVDGFRVERRVGSGNWSTVPTELRRTERSFVDHAPGGGPAALYRVRAVSRATGDSAPSETAELAAPGATP